VAIPRSKRPKLSGRLSSIHSASWAKDMVKVMQREDGYPGDQTTGAAPEAYDIARSTEQRIELVALGEHLSTVHHDEQKVAKEGVRSV